MIVGPAASDKVQKSLMEAFEKEYGGKFEDYKAGWSRNFRDTSIHMYRFDVITSRSSFEGTDDYKFSLIDLRNGKVYKADFWSGGAKKGAMYYLKRLEKFRISNGGK